MKVYIVYYADFDGEYIAHKAFLNKYKALDYMEQRIKAKSPYGWHYEEMDVVE